MQKPPSFPPVCKNTIKIILVIVLYKTRNSSPHGNIRNCLKLNRKFWLIARKKPMNNYLCSTASQHACLQSCFHIYLQNWPREKKKKEPRIWDFLYKQGLKKLHVKIFFSALFFQKIQLIQFYLNVCILSVFWLNQLQRKVFGIWFPHVYWIL